MRNRYIIPFAVLFSFLSISTAQAREPVDPILPVQNINLGQVELGKKLYFDPRLSKSGFISCNSCSGLMILDTNLGGKIHRTEVFNDNKTKNVQP